MENFKIYRDAKYDRKENFKLKVSIVTPKVVKKIDDGMKWLYTL